VGVEFGAECEKVVECDIDGEVVVRYSLFGVGEEIRGLDGGGGEWVVCVVVVMDGWGCW